MPQSDFTLSDRAHTFPPGQSSWSFQVWSSGSTDRALELEVSASQDWLTVKPTEGVSTGADDPVEITVNIDRDKLSKETHTGMIAVSSRSGYAEIEIRLVPNTEDKGQTIRKGVGAGATEEVVRGGGNGEYYVSTTGNDANPGTQSKPWRTIQHAAETSGPGDTVYILAGTYSEQVQLTESGREGARITFKGAGQSTVLNGDILLKRNTDYINIRDLTVQGFSDWGVTLDGDNDYVRISNLQVAGGEAGIHLTYGDSGRPPEEGPVSNIIIENCVVRDCEYTAVDCTPGPCNNVTFRNLEVSGAGLQGPDSFGADGIAVERGRNVVVEDCYVHDNGGDGIDLNSRDTQGNVPGIIVRRNEVARNHLMGVKLWSGGRFENNFVWGQGIMPLMIGSFPCTAVIVNNTVAYNMWSAEFGGRDYAGTIAWPNDDTGVSAPVNLTLLNNIFAFNCNDAMGGPTGLYLGRGVKLVNEGHNIYFSREDAEVIAEFVRDELDVSRADLVGSVWRAATGQGTGNRVENPRLMAPWPNVDLRLATGSPAINAGTGVDAPADDKFGTARPKGNAPDIGAHERN